MKSLKKGFVVLLLPLMAFGMAHKFYVSVTNINYSEKDDALQITSRIFIDDFERVLEERYGLKTYLATDDESELADDYVEKYIRAKFAVLVDGENKDFTFLGKKYDNDVMVCYMEVPEVDFANIESMAVQSDILTDLFEDQQNIVHFKFNGRKKSFVLARDNNKGMLNL